MRSTVHGFDSEVRTGLWSDCRRSPKFSGSCDQMGDTGVRSLDGVVLRLGVLGSVVRSWTPGSEKSMTEVRGLRGPRSGR